MTDSPIGELLLVGDERALHGLYMQAGRKPMPPNGSTIPPYSPARAAS